MSAKTVISVTGGKGGTGKSTIAVNLAVALAKIRAVTLADLDVEAPNDHILLNVKLMNEEPVMIMLPYVDYSRCIKCGVCAQVCDTGAIVMSRLKLPYVIPRLCSGCRACYFACPTKAIIEGRRVIGYTYYTLVEKKGIVMKLVTGVLREGEEHTPPVVLTAKRRALNIADDVLIIDTSAGTANHVSMALEGSRLSIAVTEPTPLGLHDLEMILKLTNMLKIESWVIINRWGIGESLKMMSRIHEIAKKHDAVVKAFIPYSKDVVESYAKGLPIVMLYPDHDVSKIFFQLAKEISEVI